MCHFTLLHIIISKYTGFCLVLFFVCFLTKINFSQIEAQEAFKSVELDIKVSWYKRYLGYSWYKSIFRTILKPYLPFNFHSFMRVYLHFQRLHIYSFLLSNMLNILVDIIHINKSSLVSSVFGGLFCLCFCLFFF